MSTVYSYVISGSTCQPIACTVDGKMWLIVILKALLKVKENHAQICCQTMKWRHESVD